MLRQFGLLKTFQITGVSAGLLLSSTIAAGSASAQLVFGGSDFNDPHIMCKAWVLGTTTMWASGEAPNEFESSDRFAYWAKKYGEETGQDLTVDCERFENISPEYRQSFEPGATYRSNSGKTMTLVQAPFLPDNWSMTPTPEEKGRAEAEKRAKAKAAGATQNETAPAERGKSAAQLAAEEAAKRRAEREAEFQAKQKAYERQLAAQQLQVKMYELAQAAMKEKKAAQQAAAEQALAQYQSQMSAHSETIRQHDAQVAAYEAERDAAAAKLIKDLDERNGLRTKEAASTDEDANRCVTSAEIQENASFKGNTAASVVNGCGKPVDVRICLMTEAKGWNCGVSFGVAPQGKWSHSSFNATGRVFVDARVSTSSRPLASPN